jgi:predicted Na+-dependent transporter
MNDGANVLVPVSLFIVMLALGTGLTTDFWRDWRPHRRLIIRVELVTCVGVPLVGLLLLCTPPGQSLSVEARHAIALMAACPSAPLIVRKAGKQGGHSGLAAQLQVIAALLAIVTVPVLAQLGQTLFSLQGWDVLPRDVALQVGQTQLLPLLLGVTLRAGAPELVNRLQPHLNRLANLLLVLLVAAILVKTSPLLHAFARANSQALLLMALLVAISLGLGFAIAGEGQQQGTTAALVTSMRNPGLALLLAGSHAPELGQVRLGILIYVLITVLLSIPVLRWQQRLGASR